jgi:hypothetical protein
MKKLTSAVAFFAGAIMASQSAHAQITPNNLYMGFQNASGGGTSDYIINLGAASNFTGLIGTGATVDLSSAFSSSLFNSSALQGSNPAGIMGGVVGASNGGNPSDVFLTELRGSSGTWYGVPGSSAPLGLSRAQDNAVFSDLSPLAGPGVGSGLLDSSKSWEHAVEPTFMAGSFYGDTGVNPDSSVNPSTILYEDLWETSSSNLSGTQPFNYEGYFTLNLTGSGTPTPVSVLTFTAAPEPSSYMLAGAGGLLMLLLRSRMSRKNA